MLDGTTNCAVEAADGSAKERVVPEPPPLLRTTLRPEPLTSLFAPPLPRAAHTPPTTNVGLEEPTPSVPSATSSLSPQRKKPTPGVGTSPPPPPVLDPRQAMTFLHYQLLLSGDGCGTPPMCFARIESTPLMVPPHRNILIARVVVTGTSILLVPSYEGTAGVVRAVTAPQCSIGIARASLVGLTLEPLVGLSLDRAIQSAVTAASAKKQSKQSTPHGGTHAGGGPGGVSIACAIIDRSPLASTASTNRTGAPPYDPLLSPSASSTGASPLLPSVGTTFLYEGVCLTVTTRSLQRWTLQFLRTSSVIKRGGIAPQPARGVASSPVAGPSKASATMGAMATSPPIDTNAPAAADGGGVGSTEPASGGIVAVLAHLNIVYESGGSTSRNRTATPLHVFAWSTPTSRVGGLVSGAFNWVRRKSTAGGKLVGSGAAAVPVVDRGPNNNTGVGGGGHSCPNTPPSAGGAASQISSFPASPSIDDACLPGFPTTHYRRSQETCAALLLAYRILPQTVHGLHIAQHLATRQPSHSVATIRNGVRASLCAFTHECDQGGAARAATMMAPSTPTTSLATTTFEPLSCMHSPPLQSGGPEPAAAASSPAAYNFFKEWQRQRLSMAHWRICDVNATFDVIPTYPPLFVVPRHTTDDDVRSAAQNERFNRRCDVLAYYCAETGTGIARSAQPQTGAVINRNVVLHALGGAGSGGGEGRLLDAFKQCVPSQSLLVMDLRDYVSAVANATRGGGHETQFARHHCDLPNIHDVLTSYKKVCSVILSATVPSPGAAAPPTAAAARGSGTLGPTGAMANTTPSGEGPNGIAGYLSEMYRASVRPGSLHPTTAPSTFQAAIAETQWVDNIARLLTAAIDCARVVRGLPASFEHVAAGAGGILGRHDGGPSSFVDHDELTFPSPAMAPFCALSKLAAVHADAGCGGGGTPSGVLDNATGIDRSGSIDDEVLPAVGCDGGGGGGSFDPSAHRMPSMESFPFNNNGSVSGNPQPNNRSQSIDSATTTHRSSEGGAATPQQQQHHQQPQLAATGAPRLVLLHCTDGWDRTSQVSAIAQLLLDPYFRTKAGFCVLVEKEFVYLGHPFQLRLTTFLAAAQPPHRRNAAPQTPKSGTVHLGGAHADTPLRRAVSGFLDAVATTAGGVMPRPASTLSIPATATSIEEEEKSITMEEDEDMCVVHSSPDRCRLHSPPGGVRAPPPVFQPDDEDGFDDLGEGGACEGSSKHATPGGPPPSHPHPHAAPPTATAAAHPPQRSASATTPQQHPQPQLANNGLGTEAGDHSPVFLQFLDAVAQLLRKYPTAFAFTEAFLLLIWDLLDSRMVLEATANHAAALREAILTRAAAAAHAAATDGQAVRAQLPMLRLHDVVDAVIAASSPPLLKGDDAGQCPFTNPAATALTGSLGGSTLGETPLGSPTTCAATSQSCGGHGPLLLHFLTPADVGLWDAFFLRHSPWWSAAATASDSAPQSISAIRCASADRGRPTASPAGKCTAAAGRAFAVSPMAGTPKRTQQQRPCSEGAAPRVDPQLAVARNNAFRTMDGAGYGGRRTPPTPARGAPHPRLSRRQQSGGNSVMSQMDEMQYDD